MTEPERTEPDRVGRDRAEPDQVARDVSASASAEAEATPEVQRPPSRGRLVAVWIALVVALGCAVYDALCGYVMYGFQIGFLALLPIVPAYLAGILLLLWVGRQRVPLLRSLAIGVGVLLALSLPIAIVTTLRLTVERF